MAEAEIDTLEPPEETSEEPSVEEQATLITERLQNLIKERKATYESLLPILESDPKLLLAIRASCLARGGRLFLDVSEEHLLVLLNIIHQRSEVFDQLRTLSLDKYNTGKSITEGTVFGGLFSPFLLTGTERQERGGVVLDIEGESKAFFKYSIDELWREAAFSYLSEAEKEKLSRMAQRIDEICNRTELVEENQKGKGKRGILERLGIDIGKKEDKKQFDISKRRKALERRKNREAMKAVELAAEE